MTDENESTKHSNADRTRRVRNYIIAQYETSNAICPLAYDKDTNELIMYAYPSEAQGRYSLKFCDEVTAFLPKDTKIILGNVNKDSIIKGDVYLEEEGTYRVKTDCEVVMMIDELSNYILC